MSGRGVSCRLLAGTHAANTTALGRILRDQFGELYTPDRLAETYREVRAAAPHVEIEPPPARGTFDIREVRDAEFFFS